LITDDDGRIDISINIRYGLYGCIIGRSIGQAVNFGRDTAIAATEGNNENDKNDNESKFSETVYPNELYNLNYS